ncbi:CRISPR-associated endoribonuclease Cas6 [Streptococcus sp. 29887]|uniref:CRISPR-associated endoribonuclease Cas6 n=2 Tax=Streptococcus iners TaxID=3028084 RepID=A0AA96VKQ1_9STRE|nr:CRISPR-associated endoribonuclease Cas6 [Streptococcus sp. 29887]MCK4025217.1 CRISPR-associated endoribonuclease Cas6 [Streptococcus suis]WNY51281.1 CRISPR-associated endoribonuclease Cas6 [Streptococcus sp. 29887]
MKKIKIYLARQEMTSNELASKLHGFLMEMIDPAYASYLHNLETNPYATRVERSSTHHIWLVSLLTNEAVEQLAPLLLSLETIQLRGSQQEIVVQKLEVENCSDQELLTIFNSSCQETQFRIHFLTPTGFKSQGDYVMFPNPRLIFQSLMQKHTRLTGGDEIDEDLLEYLCQHAKITSYQLSSHYYTIHKQKIPAFVGSVNVTIKGAETLRSYVKMLLTFGEYSGIGIKTSLGMGGIRFETRKK